MNLITGDWADRPSLIAAGLTERQIQDLRLAGRLTSIRRGCYVDAGGWSGLSAEERHRIRAREVGIALAGRAVISHESAAVLHRIPLPPMPFPRVHATWPGSPGRRGTANVQPHRGRLAPSEVIEIDGVVVTSVTRTVLDLALRSPYAVAIAALDASLRAGWIDHDIIEVMLGERPRVRGHARAGRLLDFADPRAESVGESICRLRMAQAGLPDPDLQTSIPGVRLDGGNRVDFGWESFGIVGEFDGFVKYGRLLLPGQKPGDVVFKEKIREDAIRATGRQFVRYIWANLRLDRFLSVFAPRFAAACELVGLRGWCPSQGRFLAG